MKGRSALLAAALTVGLAAHASAQVLIGRVLEAGSDRPVATARVTLIGGAVEASPGVESNDAGFFRLPLPRPGWYGVRVERIGYALAVTDTVLIGVGETVEIAVRLGVSAVPLAPLMVVERRTSAGAGTEFQRRTAAGRRSGRGFFITRADIDATRSPSVTGVLARSPQVAMEYDARGMARPVTFSQGGCVPALYLNGARFQVADGESIDEMLSPDNLEGVEIYRNPTELPPEFAGGGACGAVVFWTRTPAGGGRGGLWRFLAGGAAALAMIVLLAGT